MRLLSFIMTLLLTVACGTDPEPRLYGSLVRAGDGREGPIE